MSIAGSSRLAGVPGDARLTLVFTRDGRLRPEIDETVAAVVEGVLAPSVLWSALLAVPFACVCLWHLIAMPFICLGLDLTRWPRLLARWWARPRFGRRLAQRLGVALVVAGAVLSVAPIRPPAREMAETRFKPVVGARV